MSGAAPGELAMNQLCVTETTQQQRWQAALTVAAHATDPADCLELLRALGLAAPAPADTSCRPLDPSARAKAWRPLQKPPPRIPEPAQWTEDQL